MPRGRPDSPVKDAPRLRNQTTQGQSKPSAEAGSREEGLHREPTQLHHNNPSVNKRQTDEHVRHVKRSAAALMNGVSVVTERFATRFVSLPVDLR